MLFYEKLQTVPLFQGLTGDDLLQIIGQTRFQFGKSAPGSVIAGEGSLCHGLTTITDGQAAAITCAADHGYSVEEHVKAPYTLQPESLFGLSPHYTRTFTAITTCDTVTICKDDLLRISDEFIIFRLNLINSLSALSQKYARQLWHPSPTDTRGRLAAFIKARCTTPTGSKTVRIKMTRLAQELGCGRLAVSAALNAMQDDGRLSFSRGIISVPRLEELD